VSEKSEIYPLIIYNKESDEVEWVVGDSRLPVGDRIIILKKNAENSDIMRMKNFKRMVEA